MPPALNPKPKTQNHEPNAHLVDAPRALCSNNVAQNLNGPSTPSTPRCALCSALGDIERGIEHCCDPTRDKALGKFAIEKAGFRV